MDTLTLRALPPGHCCTFAQSEFTLRKVPQYHTHDFHEFFCVEEGEGFHEINGQCLPLRAGDLVLVRAQDCHGFAARRDGGLLRIVNFAFFARHWDDFRHRYFGGEAGHFASPSLADRSYALAAPQLAEIKAAARHLRAGARGRLHVEGFLLAVLALLQEARFWKARGEAPVPGWIAHACLQIGRERNFAGGMPRLARLAGRSPAHVAREFRRHLAQTPTDVINRARMAYAADRLANSDDTILAVALDCGLHNVGHFYRLFRDRYGCTPARYRTGQRAAAGQA